MHRVLPATAFIIAWCNPAWASPGDQLFPLMPVQPVSNADFGDAVSISGNYVLVGAEETTQDGIPAAGAAYLFEAATGTQLRVITPADPPSPRSFGTAVAVDGDRMVIGASDDNSATGAAYVFDINGNQQFKLLAAGGAASSAFGDVVAISGNTVLVGAPNALGPGGRGLAYFFDLTGVTPGSTLTAMPVQPDDLPTAPEFANALAMDGGRAIIGIDRNGLGGAAYVYDSAGNLLRKLEPPMNPDINAPARGFGRSVDISGNVAIVGAAPEVNQANPLEAGRAYLFNIETGDLIHTLQPTTSQQDDFFSDVVSISGNLAVVSQRLEEVIGGVNTAFLFDVTTGQQILQLQGDSVLPNDEAFEALALDGGRAVVGIESFDSPGFSNNGLALLFDVLVGDYNRNGVVDAADFVVWRDTDGQSVAALSGADGNGNGTVDDADYNLWQASFGKTAPTPGGAGALLSGSLRVPEPRSLFLVLAAAGMWFLGSVQSRACR